MWSCYYWRNKRWKKNKLIENIKRLEELSNNLLESIKQLKNIFKNINKNKENLKLNIQKIFYKIRNTLKEREDEILFEVDKIYDNIAKYCKIIFRKRKVNGRRMEI